MFPVILVMGVSGSGKSYVGKKIAQSAKDAFFLEGDDFHTEENIKKMTEGCPLTDEDRWPWLESIGRTAAERAVEQPVVIACSALKKVYRDKLREFLPRLFIVYVKGDKGAIGKAMERRSHFMPPLLLDSQFDILEEPGEKEGALYVQEAFGSMDELLNWVISEVI